MDVDVTKTQTKKKTTNTISAAYTPIHTQSSGLTLSLQQTPDIAESQNKSGQHHQANPGLDSASHVCFTAHPEHPVLQGWGISLSIHVLGPLVGNEVPHLVSDLIRDIRAPSS